jgi:HNH endonuclease
MNCIACDVRINESNDSDEHVIANAIGGRLKVQGVTCRLCNSKAGHEWDAALAEQLHPLSILFAIKRERGEVPPLRAATLDGDALLIHGDGSLHPVPRAPTEYQEGDQTFLRLQVPTKEGAREVLETLKQRRYPKLNVEKELAGVQIQRKFDNVVKFQLGLAGEKAGRAMVKSALALAVAHGVDAARCTNALAYLRDPAGLPPFGFYFERDPIANRPDRTPLHCVAVSNRAGEGQLLAYLEFYGVHRVVACLADHHEGPEIHCTYAINPVTGDELQIDFALGLSLRDVQRCYDYQCVPEGSRGRVRQSHAPGDGDQSQARLAGGDKESHQIWMG